MRTLTCALLSLSAALMAVPSNAQFTTIINIPTDPSPPFIGSNTQVNLYTGGSLAGPIDVGEVSDAGVNTELNVFGGGSSNARARHGTTVNLYGGGVSNLTAMTGSLVNVHNGGRSLQNLIAMAGSQVRVLGGRVENGFQLRSGGALDLSGGVVDRLTADAGSVINMSGGELTSSAPGIFATVNGQMTVSGGAWSKLALGFTSQVKFKGADFLLDGAPVPGLDNLGDTATVVVPVGSVVSGVLEDGVPFILSSHTGEVLSSTTLTLERTYSPAYAPATLHASTDAIPLGLHNLQTLIIDADNKVPRNYIAGTGSKIVVNSGVAGPPMLKAVGASIELQGGMLGQVNAFDSSLKIVDGSANTYNAFGGSIVMNDGNVDTIVLQQGTTMDLYNGSVNVPFPGSSRETLQVHRDSVLNMHGGSLGGFTRIYEGGRASITGGALGAFFVDNGGTVNISGGQLGQQFRAEGTVRFVGRNFWLDGIPVDPLPQDFAYVVSGRDKTLSGILADGSTFILPLSGKIHQSAFLTLSWVPEPSTFVLSATLLSCAATAGRQRRTLSIKARCG